MMTISIDFNYDSKLEHDSADNIYITLNAYYTKKKKIIINFHPDRDITDYIGVKGNFTAKVNFTNYGFDSPISSLYIRARL